MALRNNSGAPEREGTMEQKVPAGGRQSVIPQLAAVQTSCGTARGAGGRRVTEEKTQASSGDVLVPQASSGDVPVLPASFGDVQVLPASSGDVLVSQALSGDVPVSPASSGDVPPSPASSGDLPVSPALSGYVPVSPVLSGHVPVSPASSGDVPLSPALSGDVLIPPTSSGDVPLSPALSGNVPIPPASSGDVPLSPASSGDVPLSSASSGDVPLSPVLSGNVPIPPASSGNVPIPPALSGDVLIPPASSGDVPLPKASSGNVPIPPASFGDEQDEDYCQESDFDSDSTPSSCDYPMLSPPAQRKKTCQGMVTTSQQSLVFSMAGWHPVALAPQAMMLPAQSVSRLTSPNNVQLPTDLTVLQQQLRTTASSGDVPLPPASSGDVPLPPASSGDVPIKPASSGDEQDEDLYRPESDFDSDSTPSSCDYPMLSPPAQRKKTCQGMVTTSQQSLVFSMAGWHPVALAPQAMMLPAQSVSRLTSPNNVQLPTDLTVLQQQLRTPASSGDVPLPPASSGDVPLPPASSGDVPLPPASFGDVPIKPASSGDDRMKTTVTIRRVILILMAHLFQATCTTTQCCHHLQKGRKHAKKYQTNTMYCHLPQTDCHLPQMSCHCLKWTDTCLRRTAKHFFQETETTLPILWPISKCAHQTLTKKTF
ncbi:uncharacterized protein [Littorina saxatilis]|uniref:uncharacterized protein n=1 Tax=Littorina saxatilis TaxID=31220 RepID=UPI0038B555F2